MKTSIKNTLDLIISNQSNNLAADWDQVLSALENEAYDNEVKEAYDVALQTFPYSGRLRASYLKKLASSDITHEDLDVALSESISLFPHDPFVLATYLDLIKAKFDKGLISKTVVNDAFKLVISGNEPESTSFYGGLIAYPNCASQIEQYLKFLSQLSENEVSEIFGEDSLKVRVIRSFYHYILCKPIHQLESFVDSYKLFEKNEGDISQIEVVNKKIAATLKVEEWRTQLWRRSPLSRLALPLTEQNAGVEGTCVKAWINILAFEESHKASFTPLEHKRNLVVNTTMAINACPYHPLIYDYCYHLLVRSELLTEALEIVKIGAARNPTCNIIHFIYADALEQSKPIEAAAVYQDLIHYCLENNEPISNVLSQYVRFCGRVDGSASTFNIDDRQRRKKKIYVHSVEAIYEWARNNQQLDDSLIYTVCNALEDKYGAKKTYDIVFKPYFASAKDKPSGYLVSMAYELATKISPNDAQQLMSQISKFMSDFNATAMSTALAKRYSHIKTFQELTDSTYSTIEAAVESHSSTLDCCIPHWLYANIQTNTEAEQRKITSGIWNGLQVNNLESYIVAKNTAPIDIESLKSISADDYESHETKSELPTNLFLLLNTLPALPPNVQTIDVDYFLEALTGEALPPLPGTKLNLTLVKQRK